MTKKKPKPIDPTTRARFKREKRCFDPEHEKQIASLQAELEKRAKILSDLGNKVAALTDRMKGMVDKSLADEEAKTAHANGYHEGLEEKEKSLKESKSCFDPFHKVAGMGKPPVALTLMEIMSIFYQMKTSFVRNTDEGKIMAFIPDGMSPVLGKDNSFVRAWDRFNARLDGERS